METQGLEQAAHRLMIDNGFRPAFPPPVRAEVAAQPEALPPAAVHDLRGLGWCSIDNRESRDLDQVEVVEELEGGVLRVRVGIADVDTRVARASATDEHAAHNTTSVYVGITVFPMLPERLSTDLSSLNEDEDRLAVVVELDVDPQGKVGREDVYRALVRNHAKLDYETVGGWLEGTLPPPPELGRRPGLEAQVRLQDEVARRLLAERRRAGILDLETIEPRAVVAGGRVIDLKTVARNRARDLIEAFMVAANSAMARFLRDRGAAAIRRVVQTPKRWDRIVALASDLAHVLPAAPDAAALSAFLAKRRQADPVSFPDLSLAVVKLLGAGEYVVERRSGARRGEGHFSLGAAEYAHSTAPNRRYADLVTQRLVKAVLEGSAPAYGDEELKQVALRCSERERAARKVERSFRKKAAAAFLQSRVGETFVGLVTGASPKGTYVRVLQPPIEGRIVSRFEGLDVGDTVRVKLIHADPATGFIDFEGPGGEVRRKLERSREKKRVATRLGSRVGETFDGIVTAATDQATWVRVPRSRAVGRIVRGRRGLQAGQRVKVRLLSTDAVHGFIDFECVAGVDSRKEERTQRKRREAQELVRRVGESFDAVVSGANAHATWVRVASPPTEGRLVRGRAGLRVGDAVRVQLLGVDPRRGFIDFGRENG
jgi:exoribonuclease R